MPPEMDNDDYQPGDFSTEQRMKLAEEIEAKYKAEEGEQPEAVEDAEPAAELESELGEVDGADDEAEPAEQKLVPEKAVSREREKKRTARVEAEAARRENEELRRSIADMQRELADLKAPKPEPKKEPEDPEPDKDDNYPAWIEWHDRRRDKQAETISRDVEQIKAQQAVAKLASEVDGREKAYRDSTAPDYFDAVTHMNEQQIAHLADAHGIDLDNLTDAERAKVMPGLRREVARYNLQIAAQALDTGRNPAEVFYRTAKRFGWTGKRAAPKQAVTASRVQTIKKAQESSESLSDATGSAHDPDVVDLTSHRPGTAAYGKALAKMRAQARQAEGRA